MKTKKLKNLVKKAMGELSWPALEVAQPSGPLRIFSDPVEKLHTIFIPADPPMMVRSRNCSTSMNWGMPCSANGSIPFFPLAFP